MREATKDDLPAVLRMGRAFAEALKVPCTAEAMTNTAEGLMDSEFAELFIADGGMAGIVLFPDILSGRVNATELFWWVDPNKRGSGLGIRMLKGIEEWARAKGAEQISMMSMSGLDIDDLYIRYGYEKRETTFVKDL